MTPGMITAIAYLLSEALVAGVQINEILKASKDTGIVPPEMWDSIIADIESAEADWKNA